MTLYKIKSEEKRTYDMQAFALSPMRRAKTVPGLLKSCRGKLLRTESLTS